MLKNLFDPTTASNNDIIFQKPDEELLNAINEHDAKVDMLEKFTKRFALIFVIIMAVLWIGGDLIGLPSALVLVFGLMTIFSYPAILVMGLLWANRPAMRELAEELSGRALAEMNIPDDAVEIELLYPKKMSNSGNELMHKKECTCRQQKPPCLRRFGSVIYRGYYGNGENSILEHELMEQLGRRFKDTELAARKHIQQLQGLWRSKKVIDIIIDTRNKLFQAVYPRFLYCSV